MENTIDAPFRRVQNSNLSADKDRVLREALRVLKPGGRFAVSDVVTRGEVPAEVRQNMLLWVGCIAGAHLRIRSMWQSLPKRVLRPSISRRCEFTTFRTPGHF